MLRSKFFTFLLRFCYVYVTLLLQNRFHNRNLVKKVRIDPRRLMEKVSRDTITGAVQFSHKFHRKTPPDVVGAAEEVEVAFVCYVFVTFRLRFGYVQVEWTDILWLAAQLYADPELRHGRLERFEKVEEAGVRVFGELNTAKWWEDTEVEMRTKAAEVRYVYVTFMLRLRYVYVTFCYVYVTFMSRLCYVYVTFR
jgi:hypothetical protein